MKNLVLSSLFILAACTSRNSTEPTSDFMIIAIDKTDSLLAVRDFSAAAIFPLLHCTSTDPEYGAIVKTTAITDMRMNSVYVAAITWQGWLSSNEISRKRALDSFKYRLTNNIEQIKRMPIGFQGSAVFENIARHLNKLAQLGACNRTFIAISDLRENSCIMNAYDSAQLNRVRRDPEYLPSLFNAHCPLSSLTGIAVILVHRPTSQESDTAFHIISTALKDYLESKGATVEIRASLE